MSQQPRARQESATLSTDIDRKRIAAAEHLVTWRQSTDVEARLGEWEKFFRDVMKPFLAAPSTRRRDDELQTDAPELVRCARDGLRAVFAARECVAANNVRGVAVYLLDLTFAACRMLSLDTDGLIKRRLKGLDLGKDAKKAKAAERHRKIREDFIAILSVNSPPSITTARRMLLDRYRKEFGVENAPSESTIVNATKTTRESRKRTKSGLPNRKLPPHE